MSIKIPETIKTYCTSARETEAMKALIEYRKNDDTLENYLQSVEANLFVEKFKYDMWKFRYDLWKVVWGKVLENKYSQYEEFQDTDSYNDCFYVLYKIKRKSYCFEIVGIDGDNENGDGDEYYICASRQSTKGEESIISSEEIKKGEYNILKFENYTNSTESFTRSVYSVRINGREEITDKDIEEFQKAAKMILQYIEAN